jgi:hypothetical protein
MRKMIGMWLGVALGFVIAFVIADVLRMAGARPQTVESIGLTVSLPIVLLLGAYCGLL